MKNKDIEKQLKTLADKMPEPEFKLTYDMPEKKDYYRKGRMAVKAALTFAVIGLFLFGGVCTVNAEFRDYVFNLLKINTVDEAPVMDKGKEQEMTGEKVINDQPRDIRLAAVKNMDDILTVHYIESDSYITNWDGLFYYKDINGVRKFYKAAGEEFIPVDLKKLDRTVEVKGIKGRLDYSYYVEDSSVILYQNEAHNTVLSDGREAAFELIKGKNGRVYLQVSVNPQVGSWAYPVRYNPETGETEDFLEGIRLNGVEISDLPVLMNWILIDDNYAIVTAGAREDEKELYLVDIKEKSIKEIKAVTGLSDVWGAKILENKLFVFTGDQDTFNYISYDLDTGEKKVIYEGIAKWTEGSKADYSVSFTGGRYDLVKKDGKIYLSDEFNGQLKEIEGITDKFLSGPLINDAGNKVIVSNFEDGFMKQIGILDVNKNIFYLFDRKTDSDIEEYGIGWRDNTVFSIDGANVKQNKYFVSLYLLKE